jgi:DNA-binding GntR family transcriptional regulator
MNRDQRANVLAVSDLDHPDAETAASRGPVLKSTRSAKVYSALLAAILDHRLPPGTRLPEDEIGALFGASRTIVRAALQALAHERVVTIAPNRGAHVAEPTVDEARHVFEARSLIEPRVAALAAGRAGPADVARLERHLAEENAALAADEQSRAIALSAAFHNSIAEIAAQPILEAFVRELTSRSSLVVALYWRRRDAICERHAHHELVDAIGAGAAERAGDLMRSHLVDILSGLDLRPRPRRPGGLSDLLSAGS